MKNLKAHCRNWIQRNLPNLIVTAVIVLLFVLFFWPRIFVTIPAGHAGVLYRLFAGGTVTDFVYPEGFHVIVPWDKMQIYNLRDQIQYHEFEALSSEGLSLQLSLAIRYRTPHSTLGLLHKQIGMNYLDKVVIPETEAVIRKTVGQYTAEDLYSHQRALVEAILKESLEKVIRRFILIQSVVVREIKLPPELVRAIEQKLEQKQIAESYDFKIRQAEKKADIKRIEAAALRDYNNIVSSSLTGQVMTWKGIEATRELAASPNAKIVVVGSGKQGLPLILNTGENPSTPEAP